MLHISGKTSICLKLNFSGPKVKTHPRAEIYLRYDEFNIF